MNLPTKQSYFIFLLRNLLKKRSKSKKMSQQTKCKQFLDRISLLMFVMMDPALLCVGGREIDLKKNKNVKITIIWFKKRKEKRSCV